MRPEITFNNRTPNTDEWDALCDETKATPFQRPAWILAWQRAFSPKGNVTVEARTDGKLAGVLPLRRRLGVLASPTNWHSPLYAPVAASEDVERALLDAALRAAPALLLRFVPAQSRTATLFEQASGGRKGTSSRSRLVLRSPRVDIRDTWETYEATLSKNMLKSLRRRRRRLEELGRVDFEEIADSDELANRLDEGLALEAAGWKGRRGTAIAENPGLRRFYGDVASSAARAGRLRLAFLRLDGKPIAFHFDLVDRGVVYGLKGTYSEALSQASPSRVLRHEMIRRAFQSGLSRYEFLGADEPYKADWANASTELVALEAYRGNPYGRILELGNTRGRAGARRAHSLLSSTGSRLARARRSLIRSHSSPQA